MPQRCTATARTTGAQCGRYAIPGGKTCYYHGSASPQSKAAARRRIVEANARATLAWADVEPIGDPLKALAELAAETLAFKDALAARVNAITDIRRETDTGAEQLRAEVILYERAMDRAARLLDVLAKSGFEDRRFRLAEAQAVLVADVLNRIFDELDLTPAQRELAPIIGARHFRALAEA